MTNKRDLFWQLAEAEHPKARSFCRKLTGNREDGDDLYQDSLVQAITRFDDLRSLESFKPWLYRIIINRFRGRVRRKWLRRIVPLTRQVQESLAGEDLDRRLTTKRTLEEAFKAVSSEERALITLFEMEGWTLAELAALYGRSDGAIKVRLSRIRGKMRRALVTAHNKSSQCKVPNPKNEVDVCVAAKSGGD